MLVLVGVVAGTVVAAGWPVYVNPAVSTPIRADAIVVLGGTHDGREELGLGLARDGYAPQVVLSNPYGPNDALMNRICHGGYSFDVSCFEPTPTTTRGEAHEIRDRAIHEGWRTILVVTFTPHVSRARSIIGRCVDARVLMLANEPKMPYLYWAYHYVYQTAGFVRAATQLSC